MLFKSSTIRHKSSGVRMETPLLIPSFSSKGFHCSAQSSEVSQLMEIASELITGTYLVSAYDVSRNHVLSPDRLATKPELIVVDSGGYEVSDEYDMSEVYRLPVEDKSWSVEDLRRVLDAWPSDVPAIFVSYDHPRERKVLATQIEDARELFRCYPNQLHCFLIKQENTSQTGLDKVLSAAMAQAAEFCCFDVVGVTEKGLGGSPIDRMVNIARLRRALNEAHCEIPIHVFGSLDPISICLYTIAGAEIFDGLTWLRYAFVDHQCVYPHSHATFRHGISTKDNLQRARIITENYYYLMQLQEDLREFVATGDFGVLPHAEWMEKAHSRLQTRLNKNG